MSAARRLAMASDDPPARRRVILVALCGPETGRRWTVLGPVASLGTSEDADVEILAADLAVAPRHALLQLDGAEATLAEEPDSPGVWVNGLRVEQAVLRHGDLVRLGRMELRYLEGDAAEAAYAEELYRLATQDHMTGAANPRVLGTTLEREVERCRRYGRGLAVLLVDIDATERLNLQHGPDAGDLVIRGVADLLRSRSRKVDTVARRLGSQFAMVLPEADEGTAAGVAETIRALVAEQAFMFSGQRVGVTVTVGVATAVGGAASVDAVCAAALQALAEGKLRGRNCVVARRIVTSDPA